MVKALSAVPQAVKSNGFTKAVAYSGVAGFLSFLVVLQTELQEADLFWLVPLINWFEVLAKQYYDALRS